MADILAKLRDTVMANQSRTVFGGESPLTFSKLWSQTDAFAGGLQDRDITAGDAVGIRLSTPRAFLVAFYGTLRNGCIPVTMPSEYGTRDVITALEETGAKGYVTDETPFLTILHEADDVRVAITADCDARMGVDLPTFLENGGMNASNSRTGIDIVRRPDDGRGLIAYVGREDGDPLGVAYTREAVTAAAEIGRSVPELDGTTHHLGLLPPSNPIELLYGATAAILDGGQYHPHVAWDPETVRSLLYTDATNRTFVTPRQYDALLEFGTDADDAIAVVEPSAAPLRSDGDGDAIRLRGSPETGLTHVRTRADVDSNRLGEAVPTVDTRVVEGDRGTELVVAGSTTMDGYVDGPSRTDDPTVTVDGTTWIRTGLTDLERGDRAETAGESVHARPPY
jgi:long-chain acyl-CoA synthetase